MEKDIAIKVEHISKTFKIPHEKISSIRGAAVNAFKKKNYEEFKALDDVSFEVKKGEFFGIIGRNGSGKSTLLKILAGIYQADKGSVKINGMISPFLELGIGFNPELSGRDNVYLNATVLGLSKKEIDEKFDSIVKFSELERFIDQKLKNYSSGMQVRLAFSVSIHANRDILLMDEVLAVGDSNFQAKCLEEFNKYREMGKTVILVSHDIETIKKYCDRALHLSSGKIVEIGNAEDVTSEYISNKKFRNGGTQEIKIEKDSDKKIYIESVKFLGENNESKDFYLSGERVLIELGFCANEIVDNPIFGVVIKTRFNKVPIFITNTSFQKIKTGEIGKGSGTVIFSMENMFSNGKYAVSLAIADNTGKMFFDWQGDVGEFEVVNPKFNSGGVVDLEHKIIIKK